MASFQPYVDVPAIELHEGSFVTDPFLPNTHPESWTNSWTPIDYNRRARGSFESHEADSSEYLINLDRHLIGLTKSANGCGLPTTLEVPQHQFFNLLPHSPWNSGAEQFRNVRYVSPSGRWGGSRSSSDSARSECAVSPDATRHHVKLITDAYDSQDAYSNPSYDLPYSHSQGTWTPQPVYVPQIVTSPTLYDQSTACSMKDVQYTPDPDFEELGVEGPDCIKVESRASHELGLTHELHGIHGQVSPLLFYTDGTVKDEEADPDQDSDQEYEPRRNQARSSISGRTSASRPRRTRSSQTSKSNVISTESKVSKAGQRKGSAGSRAKPSRMVKSQRRPFECSFSHYGCQSTFASKNEWKRHVASQHLQLGFYRCDTGFCDPENSKPANRSYNDFGRKDLFTQHHRRMHTPWSPASREPSANAKTEFEESLEEVRRRCWRERRKAPPRSKCGFCNRLFEGENSWEERMEHVGKHYEKRGEGEEETEDEDLREWALREGIVRDFGPDGYWLVGIPPSVHAGASAGAGAGAGAWPRVKHEEDDDDVMDEDAEGDED